jgi:hypothetical protein
VAYCYGRKKEKEKREMREGMMWPDFTVEEEDNEPEANCFDLYRMKLDMYWNIIYFLFLVLPSTKSSSFQTITCTQRPKIFSSHLASLSRGASSLINPLSKHQQ